MVYASISAGTVQRSYPELNGDVTVVDFRTLPEGPVLPRLYKVTKTPLPLNKPPPLVLKFWYLQSEIFPCHCVLHVVLNGLNQRYWSVFGGPSLFDV